MALTIVMPINIFAADQQDTKIVELKTNDLVNPVGIDTTNPIFSWKMESAVTGQKQTAYQITVAKDKNLTDVVWDSNKQETNKSVGIEYEGEVLQQSTTYYWNVTVWDKDGVAIQSDLASFEMGLFGEDAWADSQWIQVGSSTEPPGKPITHYSIDLDMQIAQTSAVSYTHLWYVVSSVMVKAVSLLTTPIFTRILSQTDYGITATFSSWYALLLTFCTLNLTYSIGRAKLDFPGKLEEYIGSMQLLSAVVTGGISLVLLVFLKPVSRFLELDPLLVVLLVVYLFFSPAIAFVQNGYRYRYQYKQNIAIAWYTALTTVAISLVLVLSVDNKKYIARVIGIVLPTVALSAVFWIRSLWKGQIHFRWEYWLSLIHI